jgi:hypothetical protein
MIRALNFTMMMALLLASLHKVPSPHIFRAAKKSRRRSRPDAARRNYPNWSRRYSKPRCRWPNFNILTCSSVGV